MCTAQLLTSGLILSSVIFDCSSKEYDLSIQVITYEDERKFTHIPNNSISFNVKNPTKIIIVGKAYKKGKFKIYSTSSKVNS